MTKTQEEQQAAEQPDLGPTPGTLLKKAREAKGWSQKEVAQQLNFLPAYIPALEEGDYTPLPNITFVKGYLRTYANLVGINPDEVITSFRQHHPQLNQPESLKPVEVLKSNKKSGNLLFKLFSLLVILGLILLVTLWWQSRSSDTLLPIVHEEVRVDTQQGPQVLLPTSQPAAPEVEPTPDQEDQEASQEQTRSEPQSAEIHSTETAPATAVEEAVAPAVAESPSNTPFDPVSVTQNQPNRLALSFTDECWTEIRDANDRLLRSGLMRGGEQLMVEGTPPFQVVFGNGRVAQIHYLGQAVDFNQRIRANGYTSISIQ